MTTTEPLLDDTWVPASFSRRRVTTNGTTLSVLTGGPTGEVDGPPIVLLHGWPQTGRAWRHVMAPLAEHRIVVVPDLRGAGDSERPLEGYRKTDQAEDLRGVLAALGIAVPVVVVGHDIGGMVALAWAARHPDDVAALVTLDVLFPGLGLEEAMDVARGGMWHRDNRAMLAERPLTMPVLAVGGGARTGDSGGVALRPHATRLTSLVAPTGHFVAEEDPGVVPGGPGRLPRRLAPPGGHSLHFSASDGASIPEAFAGTFKHSGDVVSVADAGGCPR